MTTKEFVTFGQIPFTRLMRIRRLQEAKGTCLWCGQKRPRGEKLFQYGCLPKSRNGKEPEPEWDHRLFCNLECYRLYVEERG